MAFPRPILASSLFESLNRSPIHSIPTSCTALDSILNGGIPYGSVISLSGPHAPTRTLIAMHVFAAYLVSDSVTEAMWIDTSGNFAGGTLKEVIEAKLQQQQRVDINKVLDKAQVGRVFDLTGIEETVREILVEHEKNQGAERVVEDSQAEDMEVEEQNGEIDLEGANPYSRRKTGVRLIVVDTITQPYASMVNKNQLEAGQATLVNVQRTLTELSRKFNVAVLLLDDIGSSSAAFHQKFAQPHNSFQGVFASTMLKLPHGPTYAYGADLHLFLSRQPFGPEDAEMRKAGNRNIREGTVIEVLSDRNGDKAGRWAAFDILGINFLDI